MLSFLNGCSKNSSCDVLTFVIVLWLIKNCLCGKGKRHDDCGCEREHDCKPRCCDINIDICTIILLFVIFGGHKMFGFGNKCC